MKYQQYIKNKKLSEPNNQFPIPSEKTIMFQKKKYRASVLFECPIFVCLSLRLTWAEYRVVATRHQVCINLSVTFVFLSLDLDIEQLKHNKNNNTKNERKQETSKKHYETLRDKETSKVKRCGDKTGEGTFTFGKMPEEAEGSLMMMMMMKVSMMSMILWWGYL